MPRIAFIGAGSVIFAQHLLGDILSFPELQESEIALVDELIEEHGEMLPEYS